MERRGILKLAIFFLSLVIGRASFAIPHLPDDVAIREALAARLVAMQSLQVFYNSATVYSPDDSVPGTTALGNLAFSTMSGTKNSSEHFFFLSGRALWRSEKSPRDIAVEKKGGRVSIDTAESYSFSDHTIETYTERTGQSTGRIENALRPPDFRTVDFGLGLRNVLTKECCQAQIEMSAISGG